MHRNHEKRCLWREFQQEKEQQKHSSISCTESSSPENLVFSSRILNLMTNKIVHHDCNSHLTCNFFDCDAMISSLAKVMGLQSRQ